MISINTNSMAPWELYAPTLWCGANSMSSTCTAADTINTSPKEGNDFGKRHCYIDKTIGSSSADAVRSVAQCLLVYRKVTWSSVQKTRAELSRMRIEDDSTLLAATKRLFIGKYDGGLGNYNDFVAHIRALHSRVVRVYTKWLVVWKRVFDSAFKSKGASSSFAWMFSPDAFLIKIRYYIVLLGEFHKGRRVQDERRFTDEVQNNGLTMQLIDVVCLLCEYAARESILQYCRQRVSIEDPRDERRLLVSLNHKLSGGGDENNVSAMVLRQACDGADPWTSIWSKVLRTPEGNVDSSTIRIWLRDCEYAANYRCPFARAHPCTCAAAAATAKDTNTNGYGGASSSNSSNSARTCQPGIARCSQSSFFKMLDAPNTSSRRPAASRALKKLLQLCAEHDVSFCGTATSHALVSPSHQNTMRRATGIEDDGDYCVEMIIDCVQHACGRCNASVPNEVLRVTFAKGIVTVEPKEKVHVLPHVYCKSLNMSAQFIVGDVTKSTASNTAVSSSTRSARSAIIDLSAANSATATTEYAADWDCFRGCASEQNVVRVRVDKSIEVPLEDAEDATIESVGEKQRQMMVTCFANDNDSDDAEESRDMLTYESAGRSFTFIAAEHIYMCDGNLSYTSPCITHDLKFGGGGTRGAGLMTMACARAYCAPMEISDTTCMALRGYVVENTVGSGQPTLTDVYSPSIMRVSFSCAAEGATAESTRQGHKKHVVFTVDEIEVMHNNKAFLGAATAQAMAPPYEAYDYDDDLLQ